MEWEIEFTDEFEAWWEGLSEAEQESVRAKVILLREFGPGLRRPHSGHIRGSKHAHMKELIVQHAGEPYRVLYAFDPRREAILLIGGNKAGKDDWYGTFIPLADAIFDALLEELKLEGKI